MIIYPAIDILGGKCVRLARGDYSKVTVYSNNPVEFVSEWISMGSSWIHTVDLDGARTGNPVNDGLIREIARVSGALVQTGGGIRNIERIENLFEAGVSRVVLGTAAVQNPDMIKKAIELFNTGIAIGIDARGGYVATDGWEKRSSYKAVEFARRMVSLGVSTIIYTDVDTDGMLSGPNLSAMEKMAGSVDCNVIASGGISCLDDISALRETGVSGAITGRAIYEGKLDLSKALEVAGGDTCLQKE